MSDPTQARVPAQAQVVVIGGGIMGCSTAYHLAKNGWKDVVLLEQGRLTGGTTWHAAGLVGQLRGSRTLSKLARYGADLYARLEAETGQGLTSGERLRERGRHFPVRRRERSAQRTRCLP